MLVAQVVLLVTQAVTLVGILLLHRETMRNFAEIEASIARQQAWIESERERRWLGLP